jgi:hypothetical protein
VKRSTQRFDDRDLYTDRSIIKERQMSTIVDIVVDIVVVDCDLVYRPSDHW